MRIVLTGSGSGGHFYPLIAIAEALTEQARERKLLMPELSLLGPDPYDREALFACGISYRYVPAGKVRRYTSLKNITDAAKTVVGVFVALWRLLLVYPDVIVSKGSYTSVPVVLAAVLLRIPVVLHESDVRPGRANALVARFAHTIAISYEDTASHFPAACAAKIIRTGIPVRRHLLKAPAGDPYRILRITPASSGSPLILVLGGSQGAERVNDLMVTALDGLLPTYSILHQTGEQNAHITAESARALIKKKELLKRYYVRGFLDADALGAALSTSSLVISRAGSGSIYEVALAGKPSILIPIPEEISHDQRLNAYAYARTGAAVVMEEKNLTAHLLTAEIGRIMNDPALRERMSTAARAFASGGAAQKLAVLLVDIGLEHEQ